MLHVSGPRPHVVLLTIDRQHKRNAVDRETLTAIGEAVDEAVSNGARVVVLTGAGGHFSAGADLGGVEDHSFLDALRRALLALAEAPLVTIAAIDGFALGAGTQMASFCDVRVATESAVFGIPAAKLGIAVDQATVARVSELCGGAAARSMLLTSLTMDAKRAYELGFVQRLGGLELALEWSAEIAALAPLTIQAHKAALSAVRRTTDGAVDAVATAGFERAWQSNDLVEGRAAFAEKRKPEFRGQ
jgi:enoyl-CoA hydratase